MEVIIIAAIALLVLVILTVLIIKQGTKVGGAVDCGGAAGGTCMDADECRSQGGSSSGSCGSSGEICCITLGNEE
jgi:hypothetical protein